MILSLETKSFESYVEVLSMVIFIIAVNDIPSDYFAYERYSSRVDDRHFELLLGFFGNLDAPL